MRDVATMLLSRVPLPDEGHALDVGCGSGQGMFWFCELHPRWHVAGLDLGDDGLRAARSGGLEGILKATATALPCPARSADVIITLDVLQHLPLDGGDEVALREMHRVLKPGGVLLIRTNAQAFPKRPDDIEAQWHRYAPDELCAKLERTGFEILRLSRVNALLGLAEIPRDLRRRSASSHSSYEVVHSTPKAQWRWPAKIKRGWLRFEGRAVCAGVRLPFGRSLVALCQAR